jgi:hypothetical protein
MFIHRHDPGHNGRNGRTPEPTKGDEHRREEQSDNLVTRSSRVHVIEERPLARERTGGNTGGIGLGGILALIGLTAFGGFAKGKWY